MVLSPRDGTREKDVVLNVALMLGSYLRENLRLNVVLHSI